jgi:Tfp pilus assembly protein PilV
VCPLKNNSKRHSSLFLIELMLSLMFFALAAGICIQFFVHSHLLSQEATNLNNAVMVSQSLAEEFRAGNGMIEEMTTYYDRNWEVTYQGVATFTRSLYIVEETPDLITANIIIYADINNPIYTLEVIICP